MASSFWKRLGEVVFGKSVATRREVGVQPDTLADDVDDPERVVDMPLEDSLDLHTFQPRDVASVVEEYLFAAQKAGFAEVRVIHGRGKGVQRKIVHSVLSRHPAVAAFRTPPQTRGGWGATLVDLKPLGSDAPRRSSSVG